MRDLSPEVLLNHRRILIIEDRFEGAGVLTTYLKREGFETTVVHDGIPGQALFRHLDPALVLLDITLPGRDIHRFLFELRQTCVTPVIVLTAAADVTEKIGVLRQGADDYIPKPYNPREVTARIQAVLRRAWPAQASRSVLECDGVWVDLDALVGGVRTADGDSILLSLTRTELGVLTALLKTPYKAFTREELLASSMPDSNAQSRVIDTHVHNLRRKLEAAGVMQVPSTVRAVGYRFRSEAKLRQMGAP
ncbi:response regulator transcription factor [Pseudomonas sp. REB1044]|uniref:response regulator transcription factor n=1 Tax=Pseudomonas sp. REB1044 TaxID=2675224 RepID=UPI00315DC574